MNPEEEREKVHPMVMSIGWNPFYNNETRTAVRPLAVSRERRSKLIEGEGERE